MDKPRLHVIVERHFRSAESCHISCVVSLDRCNTLDPRASREISTQFGVQCILTKPSRAIAALSSSFNLTTNFSYSAVGK